MKKLYFILGSLLLLTACEWGIMLNPTCGSEMLFYNDTDYILEFSTPAPINLIKPFFEQGPYPKTFDIAPHDTLIYGYMIEKRINSTMVKLSYALKHVAKKITIKKKNDKGDYIGEPIIYEPPMYRDDSNDNHYFNINSWKIITLDHRGDKGAIFTFKI